MMGIIDYEAGNTRSIINALNHLQQPFFIPSCPKELHKADHLVFPGVGAAPTAMTSLRQSGLYDTLRQVAVPLLGICLGMQLLFEYSEEGNTRGLGLLSGTVRRFHTQPLSPTSTPDLSTTHFLKIPHTGWNQVRIIQKHPLFYEIPEDSYFYFVHSYYVPLNSDTPTLSTTTYGFPFASAVGKNNYYGVQFHPEKSGTAGLRLLQNFLSL